MKQRLLTAMAALTLIVTPGAAQRGGGGAPVPTISAMETQGKIGPIIRDGMLMPVTEFADTTKWIKTRLWVETDFDTDGDGKLDRLHVDVTRSAVAQEAGLKVPVIMESSPYSGGTNSPNSFLWNVKQELGVEPPPRVSRPDRPFTDTERRVENGLGRGLAATWVSRGFAVVSSEQTGTGLSTGCPTVGDVYETNGPKFVIDWLNGRAKGYTTVDGNEEVKATDWTNGRVGMIGTSYLGTLPLSAAISGVEGLEAIVPIAPNTSYYHYYRSNGLVRSPGGYLGEDVDFLYDFVHSGRVREVCDRIWRDSLFAKHRDRAHGDYNDFWAVRDQLPFVKNIHAAVFFAHGLNDWNVVPEHTTRMWEAIKKRNKDAHIYLHQGGHGGGPPADVVNKWWAHFLYDVDNGIEKSPRALIVPSAGAAPAGGGRGGAPPVAYADWPVPGSAPVKVYPGQGGSGIGSLNFNAPKKQGTEKFTDDWQVSPAVMATSPSHANRLLYAFPAFSDTVHMSGTTTVTIKLALNKPAANLSVYLVTLPYDTARIGSSGQVGVVTRGWADPQNHKSLTKPGDYHAKTRGEPLVPGKFYTLTFDLQPDDQFILPGQQLGVMILSSDIGFTLHPQAGTEITVDLDGTSISLPIVGGEKALKAAVAPRVSTN
jgi:X-Pro dipeptidyl-peptidase